jgi:hypothetical protein
VVGNKGQTVGNNKTVGGRCYGVSRDLRKGQSRLGSAERRLYEFYVVKDQVKRRKEDFQARLIRNLRRRGTCLVWKGTKDHKGYARMNFKFRGQHVTIHVHRVFMILMNCAPLPSGYEASHTQGCKHRTCVRHLQLQHYTENANVNGNEQAIPF